MGYAESLFALLLRLQLLNIKSELLSFQNVTITTSRLTRARRDSSVETTSLELLSNGGIQNTALVVLSKLANNRLALLLLLSSSSTVLKKKY